MELNSLQTELYILLNVVIASTLSGLIGLERELSGKPSGLRTHIIIGGVSALMVMLGQQLVEAYASTEISEVVRTDPIRVIQAIIIGISFLGSGTIIKSKDEDIVKHLTSAATTLLSAGIGICVAIKLYYVAAGVTIFAIAVIWLIGKFETKVLKK